MNEPNSLAEVLASQGVLYVAPNADKAQNASMPQSVSDKAVVDNNAYVSDGFANIPESPAETLPIEGEMPFDPVLYYGADNTVPVATTMNNTAPQGVMNNNGVRQAGGAAGQNIPGAAMQQQANVNRSAAGQNAYGAATQPQRNVNRNANPQMNQATVSPMVRMGAPGQQQNRTAVMRGIA